jgi:hypothetical protein
LSRRDVEVRLAQTARRFDGVTNNQPVNHHFGQLGCTAERLLLAHRDRSNLDQRTVAFGAKRTSGKCRGRVEVKRLTDAVEKVGNGGVGLPVGTVDGEFLTSVACRSAASYALDQQVMRRR